jgi:hypothetical protein
MLSITTMPLHDSRKRAYLQFEQIQSRMLFVQTHRVRSNQTVHIKGVRISRVLDTS